MLPLIAMICVIGSSHGQIEQIKADNHSTTNASTEYLFFDGFEYAVSRDNNAGSGNPFVEQGGWSNVKSENLTGSHAGFLYTVDHIPGYDGQFPGMRSDRVLAIEARPGSFGSQTDFYLQLDLPGPPSEISNGDIWFQFWIYPNYHDDINDENDQLSKFSHRFKFIYPCKNSYPCSQGNLTWLNTLGTLSSEPHWYKRSDSTLFITTVDPFAEDIRYLKAEEWNQFKISQSDVSEFIAPNRWTLVRLHYDTSSNSGVFEAWLRPMEGKWTKVAEWIDGKTDDFEWRIPENAIGGHKTFRMPTTLDDFDSWLYVDDFTVTSSQDTLPEY